VRSADVEDGTVAVAAALSDLAPPSKGYWGYDPPAYAGRRGWSVPGRELPFPELAVAVPS
jgi:hypothetical protein